MFEETHEFVLKKALGLFSTKELKEYKKEIMKGIINPDKYGRVVHHFYNPKTDKGIFPFSNAKKRGIRSFKKAVELYKKGKIKKAYFQLGSSLHYLTDLAILAHTIPVIHPLSTDDLEIFLKENTQKISKDIKITNKIKLDDYFIELAKKSRQLEAKKNSILISIKYKITKKKDKLSERKLKEQSKEVISLAISYTAGLLKFFTEEIR